MRFTLVCLAVAVIVAVAEGCAVDSDCNGKLNCHAGFTEQCVNHKCVCDHPNKRDGGCTNDAECAGTDCTNFPGDTPYCNHHGSAEHGHSNCECK